MRTRPHLGYIVDRAVTPDPPVLRWIEKLQEQALATATGIDPVAYATGSDRNAYAVVVVVGGLGDGELLEGVIARARQRGARLILAVDDLDGVTASYAESLRRLTAEADLVVTATAPVDARLAVAAREAHALTGRPDDGAAARRFLGLLLGPGAGRRALRRARPGARADRPPLTGLAVEDAPTAGRDGTRSIPYAALHPLRPGVEVVRVGDAETGDADSWSSAANAALSEAHTEHVLLVHTDVSADGVEDALLRIAERTGAVFVQPAVLDAAGDVVDAGSVFVSRGSPPARVLAGHPAEDLPDADHLPTGVVTARCVLIHLPRFTGFEPGLGAEDAIARATVTREPVVAPRVRVTDAGTALSGSAARTWFGHPTSELRSPTLDEALGASGLRVAAVTSAPADDLLWFIEANDLDGVTRPIVPIATRTEPRRMRWSIRSSAPAGEAGRLWGDHYFADDLVRALRRRGEDVVLDSRTSVGRPSEHLDGVAVTLRGLHVVPPNPAALNILWVISHPEMVTPEELERYDIVLAAGPRWAESMAPRVAVPVLPLLQATAPERFHPGDPDPELASDVLFVGKTRNVFRPIVRDAAASGADLAVYGEGWEAFLDPAAIRSEFLANDRASAAYRSARRVLNDHWDDMREQGFLSNRLFDAVASGARVVSDPIDGLEVFGGAVRSYRDPEELSRLLRSDDGWPDPGELRAIAARIAAEHSFDRRAEQLVRIVAERTAGDW